ncbi:TolC family outer membrane protein [Maricaulaceae bacterium NA33B04]|nr:TolC family outer membrane protein [Maricaulaceae bacterium NA33B04]
MKTTLRTAFIASALATSLAAGAHAQSLEETLVSAYQTNPTLAAQRARLRQAEEGYYQARAARMPSASASADVNESERWGGGFFNNPQGSIGYGVSVSQSIYRGGRTSGAIDSALARIEASRAQLRSAEQSVLIDAVAAHAEVVRDQQVVGIRSNNVAVLAEQLRAAQDRFEVGEITRTDVAQAEARLSGARAQLSAAQAALAASRARYARVTGVEVTEPQAAAAAPAVPETLGDALDTALSANPDLRAAGYNERAAELGVQIARGSLRPEVSISARANESRASDFSGRSLGQATVSANVSVPIFTGGLNRSRVREALASADEARLSSVNVRRQVIEGVTNAWNNFLAAQAVIESSRQAVRANEIAFEGVEQEAFVGLRTTLDVLNAEQELLNSRLELVRAERDFIVASYAVLQSMGLLGADTLQLPVDSQASDDVFTPRNGLDVDLTPWN